MADLISTKKTVRKLIEAGWSEARIDRYLSGLKLSSADIRAVRVPTRSEESVSSLAQTVPEIRGDIEKNFGGVRRILLGLTNQIVSLRDAVSSLANAVSKIPAPLKADPGPRRWKLHATRTHDGYDITAEER